MTLRDHLHYKFNAEVTNWMSHRPSLWYALENSTGPVLELGVGIGSTEVLHDYCKMTGRKLLSCESNRDWANNFDHLKNDFHEIHVIDDWDAFAGSDEYGVVFVDHAPGEHRWLEANKFLNCDFVVIHDTEFSAPGERGYRMNNVFPNFKYQRDDKSFDAWTTILSNKHPL